MPPLLPYFLFYCGGILAALPAANSVFWTRILPLTLILAGGFIQFKTGKNRSGPWLLMGFLLVGGYLAPSLPAYFQSSNYVLAHLQEHKRASAEGKLIALPRREAERIQYFVDLTRLTYGDKTVAVNGRARITLYQPPPHPELRPGDLVRFKKVRLKRPRNFKNPGRFNYERFLESQGIAVIGSVSDPGSIERLGYAPLPVHSALRAHLRQRLLGILDTRFDRDEGALLKGMLLGERHSLPEDLREAYIATGLAHLLAVSGLHIGFVAGASYFLFWRLVFHGLHRFKPDWVRLGYTRYVTAFLCFFPVLFYMFVVGEKVSAIRAGVMVLAFFLALLVNRKINMFNALLAAAFIILLWSPRAVLDIGFQLSFTAVTGIIFVLHHLMKSPKDPIARMGERNWLQKHLFGTSEEPSGDSNWTKRGGEWIQKAFVTGTLISFAAILATLPILIFHFNRVSLVGFLLNPFLVPLASLLIPMALLTITVGLVWPALCGLLAIPVSWLTKLFYVVPEIFADLPLASIYVPTPPGWFFLFYYAVFFGGVYLGSPNIQSEIPKWKFPSLSTWKMFSRVFETNAGFTVPSLRLLGIGLAFSAVLAAVGLLWPRFTIFPSDQLNIFVVDVGQGESIFIEFPNGETMLIDGGGYYKNSLDVGRLVLAPFIWHRGIGKIDYMAATHSDNDHISGLESLLEFFPVKHYLVRVPSFPDRRMQKLRAKAFSRNVTPLPLQIGKPLAVGEVKLLPLHPGPAFVSGSRARRIGNNQSLVLRLEYRQFSMLLTGDIEKETEEYLISEKAPLRVEYLKAPHHGSRSSNSPAFIEAVGAKAVIFSAGHLNPWRHPHKDVARRYEQAGAKVWRTDRNGAILITTDGFDHQIKSHEGL